MDLALDGSIFLIRGVELRGRLLGCIRLRHQRFQSEAKSFDWVASMCILTFEYILDTLYAVVCPVRRRGEWTKCRLLKSSLRVTSAATSCMLVVPLGLRDWGAGICHQVCHTRPTSAFAVLTPLSISNIPAMPC